MKLLNVSALAIAVLGLQLTTATPAAAGNGENTSAVSAVVSVYAVSFVAASPVLLVAAGAKKVGDASRRDTPARDKAAPLPPMAVQKVEAQADGGYHVALQRPDAPDQNALLNWPARADNPAAQLKVGDMLAFTPTAQAAGWMVTAADGATLAFLPTPQAASGQLSEQW